MSVFMAHSALWDVLGLTVHSRKPLWCNTSPIDVGGHVTIRTGNRPWWSILRVMDDLSWVVHCHGNNVLRLLFNSTLLLRYCLPKETVCHDRVNDVIMVGLHHTLLAITIQQQQLSKRMQFLSTCRKSQKKLQYSQHYATTDLVEVSQSINQSIKQSRFFIVV